MTQSAGGYLFLPPFAELEPLDKSEPSAFFAFTGESARLLYSHTLCVLQLPFVRGLRLLHLQGCGTKEIADPFDGDARSQAPVIPLA